MTTTAQKETKAHKNNSELTFEEWFSELKRLAHKSGIGSIVSEDEESYRTTFYDDGFSPNDCLVEEVDAAHD